MFLKDGRWLEFVIESIKGGKEGKCSMTRKTVRTISIEHNGNHGKLEQAVRSSFVATQNTIEARDYISNHIHNR